MLKEHGVYAMSPELGSMNGQSETFFISSPNMIKQVLEENYIWIDYVIDKLQPKLQLSLA